MGDTHDNDVIQGRSLGGVRFGLRGKLLLATLLLVNAAFVAVWWIATDSAEQGLRSLTDTTLKMGAQSLADGVNRTLSDTHADAMTMAHLDLPAQAIESGDPKNATWYADEVVRTKARYAAIIVADASGRIVAANTIDRHGRPLTVSVLGRNVSAEPWTSAARRAEASKSGVWVAPSRPQALAGVLGAGETVAGWSFPVLDIVDEPIGTLTVFLSLDGVADGLAGYTALDGDRVDSVSLVVDADGRPLVMPAGMPARSAWASAALPRPHGDGQAVAWTAPGGARLFVAQRPIGGDAAVTGWRLVLLKSAAALDAPVTRISSHLLVAFAVAITAVTVLLIAFATRFVGPIRRLTRATVETARATDYREIPVESRDEVGALTGAFNRMLATLKSYQLGLEDQVAERTRELDGARREVKDILDNIPQAIITVSSDGRINNEFSAHSRQLFGDVPIAGAPALALLQVSPDTGGEAHSRMAFWMENIHGSDELQWMLAEGEPLRSHSITRDSDGQTLHLELEYAPMYENGAVSKLMVSAKDVTHLRGLEQEVIRKGKENEDNLTRISEIASLDPELFETFLRESEVTLDDCLRALAELEAEPPQRDAIHRLFRGMHTIKGNARIFKIATVQDAAHEAESQLQVLRDRSGTISPEAVAEIRPHIERVRTLLDELEQLGNRLREQVATGREGTADACLEAAGQLREECGHHHRNLQSDSSARPPVPLVARLGRVRSLASSAGLSGIGPAVTELESALIGPVRADSNELGEALSRFGAVLDRTVSLSQELRASQQAEQFPREASDHLARIRKQVEEWRSGTPERLDEAMLQLRELKTRARQAEIYSVSEAAQSVEITLSRVGDCNGGSASEDNLARAADHDLESLGHLVAACALFSTGSSERAGPSRHQRASMKVDRNRVLELRKAYKQLSGMFEAANGSVPPALRDSVLDLGNAVQGLTMVPVSELVDRCRKLVFDLSRELGKSIADVEINANGVQVDEKILAKLRDVLLHALRNAVDHGIELPSERTRDGKPARGTIAVDCRSRDGSIVFSISDDGRGVDFTAIRRRAFENRLMTEHDLDRASHGELLSLLFLPGFSTARRVTEVSGRGVGMDVIRSAMEEMKGTAEIESVPGQGTVLTLSVPTIHHERL